MSLAILDVKWFNSNDDFHAIPINTGNTSQLEEEIESVKREIKCLTNIAAVCLVLQ